MQQVSRVGHSIRNMRWTYITEINLWNTSATVDTGTPNRYDRSSIQRFSLNLISVRSRLSDGDTLVLDGVRFGGQYRIW